MLLNTFIIQLQMRNKPYYLGVLLALLIACRPKENKVQLRAINKSLEKSSELIKGASERALVVKTF